MLLCRSGVRSHHAAIALTQVGYQRAFNVLQGFEGARIRSGNAIGWAGGAPPACPGSSVDKRAAKWGSGRATFS